MELLLDQGDKIVRMRVDGSLYQVASNEYCLRLDDPARELNLNPAAAVVWNACRAVCDGTLLQILRNVREVVEENFSEQIVTDVVGILREFERQGLLQIVAGSAGRDSPAAGGARLDVDRRYRLISHRRSGTHFLWETMRRNLGVGTSEDQCLWDIPKSHETYSSKALARFERSQAIYVIRDGRDVMVANYHYWRRGGESRMGVARSIREIGFSQFLQGRTGLDAVPEKHRKFAGAFFTNPARYWAEHTRWADHLYTVRFEDLIADPVACLAGIAAHLGLAFDPGEFEPVRKLVGHLPRKGLRGDWRSHFSDNDLEHFWSVAGKRMKELGYD